MMYWDIPVAVPLFVLFGCAALSGTFPVFNNLRRRLAGNLVDRFGFLDLYFQLCTHESLEMIRELRHYESDYRESVVDFMTETLSMPEMLLVFVFGRARKGLKPDKAFPNLTDQAQSIAHFYINVVRRQLFQALPPSGPHAVRLCSRWRRRSS